MPTSILPQNQDEKELFNDLRVKRYSSKDTV